MGYQWIYLSRSAIGASDSPSQGLWMAAGFFIESKLLYFVDNKNSHGLNISIRYFSTYRSDIKWQLLLSYFDFRVPL